MVGSDFSYPIEIFHPGFYPCAKRLRYGSGSQAEKLILRNFRKIPVGKQDNIIRFIPAGKTMDAYPFRPDNQAG